MATVVFGRDEVATLTCSANGNPLPLIQWSINGMPVDGVQEATAIRETASSVVNVSIAQVGVGTRTVECTSSVTVGSTSDLQSATVNITVQAVLQNINILPEMQSVVLDSSMNDMAMVTLNCSVEANPGPPRIEWSSNGENVTSQAEPVTQIGGILYSSELTLSVGDLEVEKNNITCLAFQDAETPPTMINDTAIVNVFGKIINLD